MCVKYFWYTCVRIAYMHLTALIPCWNWTSVLFLRGHLKVPLINNSWNWSMHKHVQCRHFVHWRVCLWENTLEWKWRGCLSEMLNMIPTRWCVFSKWAWHEMIFTPVVVVVVVVNLSISQASTTRHLEWAGLPTSFPSLVCKRPRPNRPPTLRQAILDNGHSQWINMIKGFNGIISP